MLLSTCLAVLLGAISTSEVTLSSPQLKWLFGGFGFQNAEAQLGALMTDEFRDERAIKCFRELDPSFARVYTGQWDASQAALDRFADYYDRTFRPAKTTIYATVGPMPQMPGGLDPDDYAEKVAKSLEYLVKVRRCTKLRYYCLTNELMCGDKWGWFDEPENHALYRRYCEALYRAFHRHGLAIDIVTSDGSYCRETAKHLKWAVEDLNDLTGLYCTHYYDQMEPGNPNNYWICLKEFTGAAQLAITKGKRWMLGEFGVCAMNPVREEGVMLDDRNYNMRDEKASETTALHTAEMAVAAINAGAYAALSWSFCDYPDPFPIVDGDSSAEHARFESARLVYKADVKYNKWGMFRWVDAKRDYRAYPTYYALGYFAKLFRGGASVLPTATDDRTLRVTAVENLDGSLTAAVINWGEEKDVRLAGVPLPAKPFRIYRYEAASVPYNAFNDLQPCAGTLAAKDGVLVVRVPAKSLAFVTTDYVDRVPSAVGGLRRSKDGILSWAPCGDADHRYYRVFEDGRQVASTVATAWKGAGMGKAYEVRSVDRWGNVSAAGKPEVPVENVREVKGVDHRRDGKMRKAKVGLLLLATERFRKIGAGTPRGTYAERKEREAAKMRADLTSAYDLVDPGLVWDRDADGIRAAIDLFVREKVDCILEMPVSWGEDCAHVRFLRDMPPCPVLFCQKVADKVGLGDTHDEDEFAAYLGHGTLVGSLQASGSNADYARPMFRTFLGTWDEIRARLGPFANAARARTVLKDAKVGLLASMNELMWSTYVNPSDVFRTIGPEVHFLSIAELADEVERVTEDEARAAMRAIVEGRETLSGVTEAPFVASVRATMAMERLAKRRGLDLLVLNDGDPVLFEKIGLRPGFYPTPEAGELVVTPEGDVGAGLATYALKLLAGGHVNFIEPFHIDRESGNFAAGHAGPNDYTDPRGSAKISRDVRFAKTKYRWAGAPFAWYVFPPGEKTMVGCSFRNGAFRFTSARLECLETKHFLATYSHALFRFASGNGSALFAPILEKGATQHFAIADGDVTAAVADLAFLLGVELTNY